MSITPYSSLLQHTAPIVRTMMQPLDPHICAAAMCCHVLLHMCNSDRVQDEVARRLLLAATVATFGHALNILKP